MGLQGVHEVGKFVGCHQPICHQLGTVQLGEADEEQVIVVVVVAVDVGGTNSPEADLVEPGAAQQPG